jgi:hypothetical protein
MKKLIIPFIGFALIISSCVEINNVIEPGYKPVIEAFLAPDHIVKMKVFTEIPYSFDDESNVSSAISGLSISIMGDDGNTFNLIDKGAGIYESLEILGGVGTTYSMSFEYRGRTISASTIIPPSPEGFKMDASEIARIERDFSGGFVPGQGGFTQEDRTPIGVNWENNDAVYHFVAAQYTSVVLDPIVQFPVNENGFTRPTRRFNNEPILTTNSEFLPQQFEYFGTYSIILYRLNPDYAALYENNNTSTQNISTPVSSIYNGLGIFTGINADTLELKISRQL